MVDITNKISTLRVAKAQATVSVSKQETIDAIINKAVPKGDVFASSKTTGLLGVKKTAELLPDCHPMPIEYCGIDFELNDLDITITVEVKTIYKTGVEVEAMHGASIVALNVYDMLKPIDKGIEINNVKLLSKRGGKSSFKDGEGNGFSACVVVCSDSISAGTKEDKAGKAIIEKLKTCNVEIANYQVIPDEKSEIKSIVEGNLSSDLIIFTGGTGLSERDNTPEALEGLIERKIPGIEEAIRNYGQNRTPYSMLSRSVAGTIGDTLVLALPGSTNGARESMDAIFPAVLHVFKVLKGHRHN